MKCALLFTLLLLGASLGAAPASSGFEFSSEPTDIVINNRVLLKVGGKPITVMDVTKKMDLLFYKQYPEYAGNPVARYQFYKMGWDTILNSVIDDHLMVADAEEKKVELTDGDVREELELLFGPNVVLNIDRLGMTFDEAWDLIKKELTVRRMNGMMVRSKAVADIHPKSVRQKYEEYLKAHPPEEILSYQVLTIRAKEKEEAERAALHATRLLSEQQRMIEELPGLLKEEGNEELQITLSDLFERAEKDLSLAHKGVLQALEMGMHSAPIAQSSKPGENSVKLFFLKGRKISEPPSFNEMTDQLQGELTQRAVVHHTKVYLEKLREHFGITEAYLSEMIPKHFEPFTLK